MDRYKEAIEAIKSNYPPENYTILREGLDLAIEVLEKQIPFEVGENTGDYQNDYFCAKCNNNLNYEHQLYCELCGQRQGW